MPRRNLLLCLVLFSSLAILAAGCSNEADYNPTSPVGNPGTLTLDSAQAEDFSLSALDMVNELVATVPDFAAADFATWNLAKAQGDSVQWDPVQEAYTFDFEGPVIPVEPPSTWTMSVSVWLQYRDSAGQALQYPVGATEMEVDYTTGMDMHLVEGADVSDMQYDMATNLTVSYLGGGQAYGIVGSGSSDVQVAQTTAQGSQSGQFSMTWSVDLTATVDGCPAGTATVNVQGYQLDAQYDGQGGATWTLVGPSYQASGSEEMPCVAPVN
jgi:hypothetical protein